MNRWPLLLMIAWVGATAGEPDYPALYRTLELPELDNATVTEVGRTADGLRDGLRVTLSTRASQAEMRQFFETAMAERGWRLVETEGSARMRAAGMLDQLPFAAVFEKDDMRFQVVSTPLGQESTVRISVIGG